MRLPTFRPQSWMWPGASPSLAVSGLPMLAFRWLVIACQAATLWITWPLWQQHSSPPMLPAAPLPSFDVGLPLLVSLAAALFAPLLGMALHTVLLVYAVLVDQTRLQPEIVSLAFLLWGTLPNPTARGFARAHLISMWVFAGFHKLISPTFHTETAQWMLSGFPLDLDPWLSINVGYLIAFTELGTGLLAAFPPTRTLSATVAFALHGGILLNLSPLWHDWNPSVWPWNIALAFAGFAFIAPWKEPPRQSLGQCHRLARPLIILLIVAPAGFYIGITDAYLAHHLYSSNTARATVSCRAGCLPNSNPAATWNAFNVPLPPEHRLFEQYFELTCRKGDTMVIADSRWWYREQGLDMRRLNCPAERR